jgi:ABC-2 type transport system ATP-binding protein
MVRPEQIAAAQKLRPIEERQLLGRGIMLFDLSQNQLDRTQLDRPQLDRAQLAALGEVRTPSIADLFVAVVGNHAGQATAAPKGAAR